MIARWQVQNADKFITKSKIPTSPIIPSAETLDACRKGLTRKMQRATSSAERNRIKEIRDEIDFLIDNL